MPPVDIFYRTIIHFNKQTLQMRRQRTMRAPLRGEGWKETWRTSVLWRTPSGLLRSCSHPSTAPEGTPPHRTSWKWKETFKNDHGSSPYQAAKSCSEVNWSNCCNKILNCFHPHPQILQPQHTPVTYLITPCLSRICRVGCSSKVNCPSFSVKLVSNSVSTKAGQMALKRMP